MKEGERRQKQEKKLSPDMVFEDEEASPSKIYIEEEDDVPSRSSSFIS